jgi:DNA-directed RNA polymerase specialized sigma24 family protein
VAHQPAIEALDRGDFDVTHPANEEWLSSRLPELVSTTRRMGFSEHDAEDAAHEAVACILRDAHTGRIKDVRNIGAWLHTTAQRIARKNTGRKLPCNMIACELASVSPFDEVERLEAEPGRLVVIHGAIARLPDRLRMVLVYCRFYGDSHAEAARVVGVCKGEINRLLNQARGRLCDDLATHGIVAPIRKKKLKRRAPGPRLGTYYC